MALDVGLVGLPLALPALQGLCRRGGSGQGGSAPIPPSSHPKLLRASVGVQKLLWGILGTFWGSLEGVGGFLRGVFSGIFCPTGLGSERCVHEQPQGVCCGLGGVLAALALAGLRGKLRPSAKHKAVWGQHRTRAAFMSRFRASAAAWEVCLHISSCGRVRSAVPRTACLCLGHGYVCCSA